MRNPIYQTRTEKAPKKSQVRERIILEHLPQIKYIAQRIACKLPPHIEMDDLISAGVLGLLDAAEKFDPKRGVKFKTYADRRIKGAILDSLRNLDWAPRSLRKKGKDLEKVYRGLEQRLGRPADDEEVAEELGITEEDLQQLLGQLKGINLGSFQEVASIDRSNGNGSVRYAPESPDQDPFTLFQRNELKETLTVAIDKLPQNERTVVSLYYYDELTMKEIGAVLGVNESRVSQLHTKAMIRLKGKLNKLAKD
jgi:RNA polymerase sigma factor for flagellar operon FliA